MEISVIDIFLGTLLVINIFFLKNISSNSVNKFDFERLQGTVSSLSAIIEEVRNHSENSKFHSDKLSESIIFHLHASGTIFQDRIWQTYETEVRKDWDFGLREWPRYLPILDYCSRSVDHDRHTEWQSISMSGIYSKYPDEIIDFDYVYEMDRGL